MLSKTSAILSVTNQKALCARLEPNDLIRALVYICLCHKRHPEHGDWLMGTHVEAENFVVGFAFWRVDLHRQCRLAQRSFHTALVSTMLCT